MYALITSALEIWVIRSEYKLINFIARGSFGCISSQIRNPNIKEFPGGACPRTLKRFAGSRSCLRPSLLATTVPRHAPGFPGLAPTPHFPAISHHKHTRHTRVHSVYVPRRRYAKNFEIARQAAAEAPTPATSSPVSMQDSLLFPPRIRKRGEVTRTRKLMD